MSKLEEDGALVEGGATIAPPPDAPSTPAAEPAPANGGDDLERALAEFDQSVPQAAPAPAAEPPPAEPTEPNELDRWLAEIDQQQQQPPAPTSSPAEERLRQLENESWRQGELQAVNNYCDQLQQKCPDYLPEDWVRNEVRARADED